MIQELTILDKPTAGRLGIPSEALSVFNQARASIASISRKTLFNEFHASQEKQLKPTGKAD